MNNEQLKALNERAARASKLAREIDELTKASWDSYINQRGNRYGTMSDELVRELWDAGKAELIRRREMELEELLNPPREVLPSYPVLATPFTLELPPYDPSTTVTWTATPPAEPFAIIGD